MDADFPLGRRVFVDVEQVVDRHRAEAEDVVFRRFRGVVRGRLFDRCHSTTWSLCNLFSHEADEAKARRNASATSPIASRALSKRWVRRIKAWIIPS